jgi:hypothetical protein
MPRLPIGRAIRSRPASAAIAVALVLMGAGVLFLLLQREEEQPGDPLATLLDRLPESEVELEAGPLPPGPRYEIASVREGAAVRLRSKPGGRVVAKLEDRTEFGSSRTFWVAERREGWLGVVAPEVGNGELGWLPDDPDAVELYPTAYAVHADLSRQMVAITYGRRVLSRFPVTVGRAGSETPPGAYAVTDALAGGKLGPYYGCCVLALSGHQTSLPSDWIGGDRIAIHGTPGPVGGAASLGCMRAANDDMVDLFALVPLGAPVFIRA